MKSVAGEWRGRFSYDQNGLPGSGFTLHLRAGFFGRFRGYAVDDDPRLAADRPRVRGRVIGDAITFTKQYDTFFVAGPKHGTETLEEYFEREYSIVLEEKAPGLTIHYTGRYEPRRDVFRGRWEIRKGELLLKVNDQNATWPIREAGGRWIMKRDARPRR
jgi:hypothetical protein